MLNKNIIKKKSPKDSLKKNNEKREKIDNSINYNIFQIIENNNLNKLSELLKKDHSKINVLNKEGFSALHISIIKGNLDLLNILLLNGANPNILSSKKKQSPLHLAYIYKNPNKNEIIKKLKKYKAKENIYDIYNKKPLDYLNKKSIDKYINASECNIFKNKKSNINEKRNKNKNFIENNNKNININAHYNKFQKLNFKIEGDIDNCENDDNDFDNHEIIKKKYHYEIKLKNINQNNKTNKDINNNIINNDTDDIIICSFDDSLEKDYKPIKNKIKNNKTSIQSRNNSNNEKNNFSCGYPILYNNILNNNIKNRINDDNKSEFIQAKIHKNINSNNDINKIKIDEFFKEIIKKKKQSLKLRKNNTFFRIKKNNSNIDNNINLANKNYFINSNTEHNSINENFPFIKSREKNYTNKTSSITQNNTGFISAFSTENQTKKRNTKDKITVITNKDVVEFKYGDSFTEDNTNTGKKSNTNNNTNNNTINITNNTLNKNNNIIKTYNNNISNNTSFNVLNKDSVTYNDNYTNVLTNKNINKINTDISDPLIEKSLEELKIWLDNIDLSIYYDNFKEANIYDINNLINQMKNPENKLGYDDIETILKIHKPGHIYRILCSLEIDAGLIKENVVRFLIKKDKNKNKDNNIKINNNKLKLSMSKDNNSCNCYRISFLSSKKKYDLKSFLIRHNLLNFFQNFYHNGFNLINFVMIQMFSSEPIDEIILENCFHIYEAKQREIVLKSIIDEKNKINFFLNSYEYLNFEYKDKIKYEDITFDENEINENGIIKIPNNNSCTECIII